MKTKDEVISTIMRGLNIDLIPLQVDDGLRNAYAEGYKAGYEQSHEDEYQRGLDDAWEVARKMVLDDCFSLTEMEAIFGYDSYSEILRNYSADEALDVVKRYEDRKKVEIKVGDEVISEESVSFIVTNIIPESGCVSGIDAKGRSYSYLRSEINGITGRRFPQVAELLKAMEEA